MFSLAGTALALSLAALSSLPVARAGITELWWNITYGTSIIFSSTAVLSKFTLFHLSRGCQPRWSLPASRNRRQQFLAVSQFSENKRVFLAFMWSYKGGIDIQVCGVCPPPTLLPDFDATIARSVRLYCTPFASRITWVTTDSLPP